VLRIDGTPPRLRRQACEELLCQQYWHRGRLEDEADVVLLKVEGAWYQLYFDAGVVHWARQEGGPAPRAAQRNEPFAYPLVDLGAELGVRGKVIAECVSEETEVGERLTLRFVSGLAISFSNTGDRTTVQVVQ
jgi:hypothetical protein